MFRSRALRFIFCQVCEKIGMAKTIGDIPYHYNPIESRDRMFEVGSISPDRKKLPILGSLPGKDELMPYRFQIFLIENKEINSIDDIDSIYNSFYLASWLPQHYQLKILRRTRIEKSPYFVDDVDLKTRHNPQDTEECDHLRFKELEKKVIAGRPAKRREVDKQTEKSNQLQVISLAMIRYEIELIGKEKMVFPISVQFLSDPGSEFIAITVEDPSGFFKILPEIPDAKRTPTIWLRKPKELYYPYIEPEDIRTVITHDTPHFHLAFQGGGAKGAAYVGAVQALKDEYPDVPIKSIIGSSAGGIIAMALATGCSSESLVRCCQEMIKIPKDTTVKGPEDVKDFEICKGITKQLKQAVIDYGLIPENAMPLIERIFEPQFIETALELLSHAMDGIGEMFEFHEEPENNNNNSLSRPLLERGDQEINRTNRVGAEKPKKKLNYYGLLQGKLLRGEAVKNLALDILEEYLNKPSKERSFTNLQTLQQWHREMASMNRREVAAALTMEQFYKLADVEFTVTSVDIDSKILRFFNHKTTPKLPVHMAVIMTGSFPVAFEALAWKPQWGKYYIHYKRWRKEIDLTGNHFTDGGMLANFPMEYFDNENIRPMYFSRKCHYEAGKNNTRIVGFGLEEIKDPIAVVQPKGLSVKELFQHLSTLAQNSLPWCWKARIAWHFKFSRWEQIEAFDLSQIPLFGFLYKLLKTYISAADNLVSQCFEETICLQSPYRSITKSLKIPGNILDSQVHRRNEEASRNTKQEFKMVVQKIRQVTDFYDAQARLRERAREYLQNGKKKGYNAEEFYAAKKYIKGIFLSIYNINLSRKNLLFSTLVPEHARSGEIQAELELLQVKMQKENQLRGLVENARYYEPLIGTFQPQSINEIIQIWNEVPKELPSCVKNPEPLYTNISELSNTWFQSWSIIEQTREQLIRLAEREKRYDIVEKILFKERENAIRAYINCQLSQRKTSRHLHLVFQGKGEYNIFSYRIFKLVEDCLFKHVYTQTHKVQKEAAALIIKEACPDYSERKKFETAIELNQELIINLQKFRQEKKINLQRLHETIDFSNNKTIQDILTRLAENKLEVQSPQRITSVTCGSMHSFFGFLLATGFQTSVIEEALNKMNQQFGLDLINSKLQWEKQDWVLTHKCRINKEFQQHLWQSRYELFEHLEEQVKIQPNYTEQLLKQLYDIRREFEESKELILNSYDSVIEHLLASTEQSMKDKEFEKKLAEQMSLKLSREDYFKKNRQISEDTKKFVSMMQEYFEEQIRFILYISASETEKELMSRSDISAQVKKDMWKCMVITRFLTCNKLKLKVQEVLAQLKLPKDITLADFYKLAPRKIELTFSAVDITTKKMRFINQKTFPEMPLWAAVAIGSSLPMIFPIFKVQAHWCRDIKTNTEVRLVKAFFAEGSFTRSPNFVSGNLISSFPLDLLTNRKIIKEFFRYSDYTMLNFGVQPQPPEENIENGELKSQYLRKYLTVGQLLKLKFYPKMEFNLKGSIRGNLLTTYINSHDNLVVELYNKELLLLPVRFSTLSFYRFRPTDGNMSKVLKTVLNETYLTTREKFKPSSFEDSAPIQKVRRTKKVGFVPRAQGEVTEINLTYIQAELVDDVKENDNEEGAISKKLTGSSEAILPPQKKLVLSFISKERSNKDFTKKYKIKYSFTNNLYKWVEVTDQRIEIKRAPRARDVEQMEAPQFVYLRFYYPVKSRSDDKEPSKFDIKQSKFELNVSDLFSSLRGEAIFQIDYKKIGCGELKLVTPFSQQFGRRNARELERDPRLPYKSVIDVPTTGLYCTTCCKQLDHIVSGIPPPRKCSGCKKLRGLKFSCPFNVPHESYCLECCKDHVIVRRGHNLWCEQNHPYIAEDSRLLPASARPEIICDMCQLFVDVFYNDNSCNISICTKCCTKLSLHHVPAK